VPDLTSHDPIKRWAAEATHLEPTELVKLGIELLEEISDWPTPWTEVSTEDCPPERWLLQGDLLREGKTLPAEVPLS
jgi:hypothetical protein